ncbi:MAG: hypothetical protein AAB038_02475 [Planctomycetota bacterium]
MTVDPLPDGRQSVTIGVLDFAPDINPGKMPYIALDFNISKYFTDTLFRMLGDKKINTVHINGKCPAVEPDSITAELLKCAKDGVDYYLIGNIQECRFIDSYEKSAGAIKIVLEIKLFHLPSKSVVFSKLGLFAYESAEFQTEIYKSSGGSYIVEQPRVTIYRYETIPENEISKYWDIAVFNALKMIVNDPTFIDKIVK